MNFFLILPLREMALRRIAVVLVNRPEFLATIQEFSYETAFLHEKKWMATFSRRIKAAISKLPLPPSLLKEMTPILKGVGSEILKWKLIHKPLLGGIDVQAVDTWDWCDSPYFNDSYRDFDARLFEKLCWTTAGAIDYQKTSEKIVHSDLVDNVQRVKLACLYCLEDCIPSFWNGLPELKKKFFFSDDRGFRLQVGEPHLQLFLPYILKQNAWRRIPPLETIRDDCLKYSALLGNKTTIEYFLSKLSEENRAAALFQTAMDVTTSQDACPPAVFDPVEIRLKEVYRYLLSLLNSEDQLRIFREHPREVMIFFFDWPWQDLCLEIAEVVWPFFPENEYTWLTSMIKNYMSRPGYYSPNFFRSFFELSPRKFRKYILVEECLTVFFLTTFFRAEDFGNIRLIFENLDPCDKERLVFSKKFLKLLDDYLLKNKWHIVEECIKIAMLSNKDLGMLKKAFEKTVTDNFRNKITKRKNKQEVERKNKQEVERKNKRKRLLNFLDRISSNTAGKKSSDVETLVPVKRLRSN